jgi:hypothetical protein
MNRFNKWRRERRKEKRLAMQYARQTTKIQSIELSLAYSDLAVIRETLSRDADFQKRKGMRDYIA